MVPESAPDQKVQERAPAPFHIGIPESDPGLVPEQVPEHEPVVVLGPVPETVMTARSVLPVLLVLVSFQEAVRRMAPQSLQRPVS